MLGRIFGIIAPSMGRIFGIIAPSMGIHFGIITPYMGFRMRKNGLQVIKDWWYLELWV
jgi:hypothetical protein